MSLIQTIVTAGSQATVSFTVSSAYKNLRLVWTARGTAVAGSVNMGVQFNGDSGSNYDYTIWTAGGATPQFAQTLGLFVSIPAASASSNMAAAGQAVIPSYARTVFQKNLFSYSNRNVNTLVAPEVYQGVVGWRSTAAITSLVLSLDSGNFLNGSVFSLYGI